jgi:transposase InsO family protein
MLVGKRKDPGSPVASPPELGIRLERKYEYIKLFYNRRRIHQSLNYQTPMNCNPMSVSA